MNFTLNLSDEETDALTAKVQAVNTSLKVNLTPEQYLLEDILGTAIKQMVAEAYHGAVQRLGVTAASLPYAQRQALIRQVEEAVQ
jgi:hypothetical protein